MAFLKVNHSGFEQARRLAGGSDKKLADLFHVDPATLCRVLSGKSEPPSRLVAGAICALGAGAIQLLFDAVDEKR